MGHIYGRFRQLPEPKRLPRFPAQPRGADLPPVPQGGDVVEDKLRALIELLESKSRKQQLRQQRQLQRQQMQGGHHDVMGSNDVIPEEEEEEVQQEEASSAAVAAPLPVAPPSTKRNLPSQPRNRLGGDKSEGQTLQYLSQLESVARRLKNELIQEVLIK